MMTGLSFGRFGKRCGIADRRNHVRKPRDAQVGPIRNGVFLQLGVEREQHRTHGRGRCDLVSAHGRLGEMLERGRLVVPFDEVAHKRRRVYG